MNSLLNESDEALLELLRQGDTTAFERIYRRYWSTLYAQAYKRLKSRENTEELIQDFFTDLWERREHLTIHTSLEAYLRRSITYLVIQYFQKEEVRDRYLTYWIQHSSSVTSCTDEELALGELQTHVDQCVEQLSPQSKLVYELSRVHHLSIPEIARRLNISEKTAENHLTRALKTLRVYLKEYIVLMLVFFI